MRAYAINYGETQLIQQRPNGFRPGQDVAGVVVAAAADGSGPQAGTRVVARLEWDGWAVRVAAPTRRLAEPPQSVSFEQAATLPISGVTALRALRVGGSVLGRQVLVTGATGGVGQFAVQLAAAAGATVTAQVSSPERAAEAREQGAHKVVTSLDDDTLGPFHLVLDGVGGQLLAQAVRRMARGGKLALYGNVGGPAELRLADFYSQAWMGEIVGFISDAEPGTFAEDLALLAGLIADGRLHPRIGMRLDWTETPKALRALTDRQVRGKAVLTRRAIRAKHHPMICGLTRRHTRQLGTH
ncbi:zinc-binding dehydrogenase [Nocardia sp. 2YAB30]